MFFALGKGLKTSLTEEEMDYMQLTHLKIAEHYYLMELGQLEEIEMKECEMGKKVDDTRVAIKNEEKVENFHHLQCSKQDCMVGEINDEQEIEHDDPLQIYLP